MDCSFWLLRNHSASHSNIKAWAKWRKPQHKFIEIALISSLLAVDMSPFVIFCATSRHLLGTEFNFQCNVSIINIVNCMQLKGLWKSGNCESADHNQMLAFVGWQNSMFITIKENPCSFSEYSYWTQSLKKSIAVFKLNIYVLARTSKRTNGRLS